jgi:hypothetical protein
VGQDLTLPQPRKEGDASVFIGIDANESRKRGIEGEDDTQEEMPGVHYQGQVLTAREMHLGDKTVTVALWNRKVFTQIS